MKKIQVTNGHTYKVDTTHQLAGKQAVKRNWVLQGCEMTILGIRAGAKVRDSFAFVAKIDNYTFLISRGAFKVIN